MHTPYPATGTPASTTRVGRRLVLLAMTPSLLVGTAASTSALEPVTPANATGTTAPCPNPYGGGACLGPLLRGTYRTTVFSTPFTVEVADGWANYEDEPGNFLLVPSGGSLDGVDAGTSDYVGVYQGVAIADPDCFEGPSVDQTAAEMAATLADRDGLVVSEPVPVEVGGLSGYMIDIVADSESEAACRVDDFPYPFVPLIIGAGPASLGHAQVVDDSTTRLYFLDHGETNIVIEVFDAPAAPGSTDEYVAVIESLEFATTDQ